MKPNKTLILFFSLTLFWAGTNAARAASLNDPLARPKDDLYQKILVKRVLSADTVILDNDMRVKLIGRKAPAPPRRRSTEYDEKGFVLPERVTLETTIEDAAFDFAVRLMEDKEVRVEFDVNEKDENFMTIAYIFLADSNLFVNAEILRQGFATLKIRPPNTKYADQLREAYREARQEKRGLQNE